MKLLQVLLYALSWAALSLSLNLDDVFTIKTAADPTRPGPGQYGGICSAEQTAKLRDWWDDSRALTMNVLEGLGNAGHSEAMRNNLLAYFDIHFHNIHSSNPYLDQTDGSPQRFQSLLTTFQGLATFISKETNLFAENPKAFCGDEWLQETEYLRSIPDGSIMRYFDHQGQIHDVNLRTTRITDSPSFQQSTIDWLNLMQQRSPSNSDWANYAYWSTDQRRYEVRPYDHKYPGQPAGFCKDAGLDAMAHRLGPDPYLGSFTMCPPLWTDPRYKADTIAEALNLGSSRQLGGSLRNTRPRSIVLMHELLHLAGGDFANTRDVVYGISECITLARTASNQCVTNPDSLSYFAWSYYLSTQPPPQYRYDWSSGRCRVFGA